MSATIYYLYQYQKHAWPKFKLAYIVHWLDTSGAEHRTKVRGVNTPAAARIKLASAMADFEDFLGPVQVVRDNK